MFVFLRFIIIFTFYQHVETIAKCKKSRFLYTNTSTCYAFRTSDAILIPERIKDSTQFRISKRAMHLTHHRETTDVQENTKPLVVNTSLALRLEPKPPHPFGRLANLSAFFLKRRLNFRVHHKWSSPLESLGLVS